MDSPSYTVIVSPRALRQLDDTCDYIHAQGAPLAALATAARLEAVIEELEMYPHRGRSVGGDIRELVTVRPYIIRYRVRPGVVQVLSIRHGAQRPD